MQRTETGSSELLLGGLPVEDRDNGKEAIICCCSSHCSIGGQFLHRGIQGCISAIGGTTCQTFVLHANGDVFSRALT